MGHAANAMQAVNDFATQALVVPLGLTGRKVAGLERKRLSSNVQETVFA